MDALAARDSFLAALPYPISWNEWQHQLRLRGLPQLPSGEYCAAMTARFGPDCMVTLKQSKTPGPAPDRRCASCPTELPAPHAVTESPSPPWSSFLTALQHPISWNMWQQNLRSLQLPQAPCSVYREAMVQRFGSVFTEQITQPAPWMNQLHRCIPVPLSWNDWQHLCATLRTPCSTYADYRSFAAKTWGTGWERRITPLTFEHKSTLLAKIHVGRKSSCARPRRAWKRAHTHLRALLRLLRDSSSEASLRRAQHLAERLCTFASQQDLRRGRCQSLAQLRNLRPSSRISMWASSGHDTTVAAPTSAV